MGIHALKPGTCDNAPLARGTAKWSRAEGGFTLIELIVVIVILGVLAVVIAPRYFNMADQAREQLGNHALSEGVVHFNLAFMKYVVDNSAPPEDLDAMSGTGYLGLSSGTVQAGDYRFSYAQPNSDVTISAEVLENGSWTAVTDRNGAAMTRTIPWP